MTESNEPDLSPEELSQKLNLETGKIEWLELQRSFARGVIIVVSPAISLIEVGTQLSADNKEQFEAWLSKGHVWRANESDAKRWNDSNQLFWSVVIAPWVLVQEINETPGTID